MTPTDAHRELARALAAVVRVNRVRARYLHRLRLARDLVMEMHHADTATSSVTGNRASSVIPLRPPR